MDYLIEQGIKVDAIITDPPYAVTGYSWDQIIPFDKMWDKLLKLIKDDGAIVLFGNEPFSSNLRMSNEKLYRYDWKWVKTQVTGFQNANYQPLRCYEDVMVFSKGGTVHQAHNHMCYYPQGIISVNLKVSRSAIDYLSEKKNKEKKDPMSPKGRILRGEVIRGRSNWKSSRPVERSRTLCGTRSGRCRFSRHRQTECLRPNCCRKARRRRGIRDS